MEGPARQAENFLWERSSVWGGLCIVCNSEMSRGIGEHMPSQAHWKNLWKKLGQQVPALDVACNWEQPWVQLFNTPSGTYMFNHVTGHHALEATILASATDREQQSVEEHQSSQPSRVADAHVLTLQQAQSNTQESSQQLNGNRPAAENVLAPQPAEWNKQVITETSQQLNGNRSAEEGLDLPAWVWKRYVRTGALELDRMLSEHGNGAALMKCKVCEVDFGAQVSEHLSSPGHFRCLKARMSDAKEEVVCLQLDSGPWVQEMSVASGNKLCFNHLTGEVHCKKP